MQRVTGPDGVTRNQTTYTLRTFGGQALSVWSVDAISGALSWKEDAIYRGGQLLARESPSGTMHYTLDHLGSPRAITNAAGTLIGTQQFAPFGGGGSSDGGALQFTGHERDAANLGGGITELPDYMHARYYDPVWGRFLSVDPVVNAQALNFPQLWNRYAYVGNNPLKYTDPTGRLLQIGSCEQDENSDQCRTDFGLFLSTFGDRATEAARYLQVGKNGIVTFKDTTGDAFAARFGLMGQATNYLVSNPAPFRFVTGRSDKTGEGHGAYFEANVYRDFMSLFWGDKYPGGGTIGVDVSAFPQPFFGVPDASATEGLVHEIGHAVASLFPGYAASVDSMAAATMFMKMGSTGRQEAYATTFENAWRRQVLGASTLRNGYSSEYDVRDIGKTSLFP